MLKSNHETIFFTYSNDMIGEIRVQLYQIHSIFYSYYNIYATYWSHIKLKQYLKIHYGYKYIPLVSLPYLPLPTHISQSHQENSINASIVLRVVCDLSVLAPHNLPWLRDQTQFTDVDLYHRSLSDDPKACVHCGAGVFLYAKNWKLERSLKFRMCYICFFET